MPVTKSVICVWCSRVMEWGQRGLVYDLCAACEPTFQNSLVLAASGSHGPMTPHRESQKKAAALG